MGSQCCPQCSNNQNLEKVQLLKNQTQNLWVRKLQLNNCQKIIIAPKTQTQPEKYYYYRHDNHDYLRGIIFFKTYFYEGEIDKNHAACGKGIERFYIKNPNNPSQQMKASYQGNFQDNLRQGQGQYQDKGMKFKGKWKKGYPISGQLVIKANVISGSQVLAAGNYIVNNISLNKDLTTGEVSMILPDKSKYEGQIVKNNKDMFIIEGRGIMTMPNGQKFDGNFKDGKFHGQGKYYWSLKKRFQGNYQNGLKEGPGKLYCLQNKYIQGEWRNDKKEGVFKIIQLNNVGKKNEIEKLKFKNDQRIE